MEIKTGSKPDAASDFNAAFAKWRPTFESVMTAQRWPGLSCAHANDLLSRPPANDAEAAARLKMRKEQCGAGNRDEIKTFVDVIDCDEKRI